MFSRLGGDGDVVVNTRVIATTQDHLEKEMIAGNFREDLFFRINVINITVPPLRDRREQILPLSQYFFDFYKKKYGRETSSFSSKAMNAFREYPWPGNIRELENIIKRMVIFGEEDTTLQGLLGKRWDNGLERDFEDSTSNPSTKKKPFNLKEVGKKAAEEAEREIIQTVLQRTHWNRKEAAKLLRVSYKALLYKVEKYNLNTVKEFQTIEEETS